MSIPTLTPLPPYPSRTASPETWATMADAFVAAEFNFVNVDMNTQVIPAMNAAVTQVNFDADEAAQAAQDASQDRIDAFAYKNAAELAASNAATSESNAADSELAASGYASAASASETAAEGFRDEAETYRNQALQYRNEAEAIVVGDVVDDVSLSPIKIRSAFNDSIGNFENVEVSTSTAINPLQFARITATGAPVSVTLPASPSDGQIFMVGNLTSRTDHQILVGSIPVKGQDAGGSIIIDKPFYTVTLKYVNATYGLEIL